MRHDGPVARRQTDGWRPHGLHVLALAAAVTVLAAGCVGSVDRDQFDHIVQERGGGLSQRLVLEAVSALEEELDVDPLLVQSITATNETVTIEAVSPEFPDEIDRYTYGGGDLDGPEPASQNPAVTIPDIVVSDLPPGVELPDEVQDLVDGLGGTDAGSPAGPMFSVDEIALDRLDEIVDDAIDTADLRGGYADSVTISAPAGGGPLIRVSVTNDRRDVTVTYSADGQPLAVS